MKGKDRRVEKPSPRTFVQEEVHLQSETLPDELFIRIMGYLPFRTVVASFGAANKMFMRAANVEWFCANVRELTVVPSPTTPTIADGLAHAVNTRELWLLPGVYRDSIRITKNISISGVGKLGSVVVEAPGWNDAIYFAGLGMDGEYVNPKTPDTGELADVSNLVFRAPNPEQGFIAHIVRGTPAIHHCEIQGGIWISGCRPKLTNNTIRWSRSCGVKITDRAAPELSRNVIVQNKFGGVKVKRSSPVLARNQIVDNQSFGVVITTDSQPALFGNEVKDRLDHPKFNSLAGVYGPISATQTCGFCGSIWAQSSLNTMKAHIASGDAKVMSRQGQRNENSEMEEMKSPSGRSSITPRGSKGSMKMGVSVREESSHSQDPSNEDGCFLNHCCWVEPEEVSSDDEQLFGDDDIGNL